MILHSQLLTGYEEQISTAQLLHVSGHSGTASGVVAPRPLIPTIAALHTAVISVEVSVGI